MLTRNCDKCGQSMNQRTTFNKKFTADIVTVKEGKGPNGSDIETRFGLPFEVKLTDEVEHDICQRCAFSAIMAVLKTYPHNES